MKSRYASVRGWSLAPICLLAGSCVLLTGCQSGLFDQGMVTGMVESNLISLDGEEIMLSDSQVQCGVQDELWDITQLGQYRAVGHLLPAAQNLHFTDDVVIGEQGMHQAYVQIRGTFQARVLDMGSVRDDGPKAKVADVKIGVEIPHQCFHDLPLLMAVRRGRFTQDALPTLRFRSTDGDNWVYDRIQH